MIRMMLKISGQIPEAGHFQQVPSRRRRPRGVLKLLIAAVKPDEVLAPVRGLLGKLSLVECAATAL
jgi:hypothetical protein